MVAYYREYGYVKKKVELSQML